MIELYDEIGKICLNVNDTILDLGCGTKPFVKFGKTTTVDAWEKLNPDYLLDLEKEELPFENDSFDYIFMIDFIEHLSKENGKKLLEQCKKIVRKKILIFTPLVWDDNSGNVNDKNNWAYGNEFDYHKSLWTVNDFKDWITTYNNNISYFGYWDKEKH